MSQRNLVVFWAANNYDGLPATDHHLARALTEHVDVLWVDPPVSGVSLRRVQPTVRDLSAGLQVMQVPALPAASRRVVRTVTELQQQGAVAAWLARHGRRAWATISVSARTLLPRRGGGTTVLHVTDDWLAGADMMGLDRAWLEGNLRRNVHAADVVSAVSVDLAQNLQLMNPRHPVEVVPNGAALPAEPVQVERERTAVLVGQLNERLDVALLAAVVDAGLPLRIIGPRTERNPDATARLDDLLGRPEVDWRGALPHDEMLPLLASGAVGLTPYAINDFNRASFPLKTLEYLGLGLPVVSSRLESLDWLGTDLVAVADDPAQFAAAAVALADQPRDAALEQRRVDFAKEHSWAARAEALLEAIERRS